MSATLAIEPPRQRARQLLGNAVHRYHHFSVDGLLERLFTFAFNGLVYPQIWEDPVVDTAAMELQPHHHVVAIASGGCNVLSYLTADPAKITAVDLSPAHVALVRLKLAGLRHLPDWSGFYRFFGEAKSPRNIADYHRVLRQHLDQQTKEYWEGRLATGRRRLSRFERNIYRKGMLGRFIAVGHLAAWFGGRNLQSFAACRTLADQRAYFDRELAPLLDSRLVRWLSKYRAALFGLGIPPSQFVALAEGKEMVDVLRERLERLACDYPIGENYFAWQAFNRGYAPKAAGPLPPYLQEANFGFLRARADRVRVLHASLTETIAEMPQGSAHRFVLLDAQDWMNDAQLNDLWSAINHSAAPDARVIFRTAGRKTILPGRIFPGTLARWTYLETLSAKLGAEDRSSIYGGFHVYQFNG